MTEMDKEVSVVGFSEWYLSIASVVSTRSKDPSTKVGAVIVDKTGRPAAFGYNGFPRGVSDFVERWKRPTKYNYVVHAEANAILNSRGRDIDGGTLYITHWPPCQECSKLIVQSGIRSVVCGDRRISKNSDPQCIATTDILSEGGVCATILDGNTGQYVFLNDRLREEEIK